MRQQAPPTIGTEWTRFWAKVSIAEPDDCWEWTAGRTPKGYGVFQTSNGDGTIRAHKWIYQVTRGRVPNGYVVDHRCRNKSCVNPGHLRAATHKQNQENKQGAPRSNKTSGVLGVSWHRRGRKWTANVQSDGHYYHLGLFDTIQEAERVVVAKRLELFTHNEGDRR